MADSIMVGLDDWLKYLDDSPKKLQQGARVGLYAGAKLIEAQAKENCPVGAPAGENAKTYGGYPGALRDSIRATVGEKGGRVFASVRAGGKTPSGAIIFYAHIIEFTGAAAHVIRGRNGRRLTFGGRSYSALHHPGMQAHPFLRPALDARTLDAIALVEEEVKAVLKK